jgi:DNA processing protein
LGPKGVLDALKRLDTPSRIFELTVTELEGLRLPTKTAQFIFDGKARAAAEVEWIKVAAQNATIVTFGCAAYPERLREIYDPPPVLWLRGRRATVKPAGDRRGGKAASVALWHRCGGDAA